MRWLVAYGNEYMFIDRANKDACLLACDVQKFAIFEQCFVIPRSDRRYSHIITMRGK